MLNAKNRLWSCRSLLLASALVGLSACDDPIGVRMDVSPEVGCAGSPVELSWAGDGNANYTLVHADGRRERVKARDSRTLKAEDVPRTRLTATRFLSPGFSSGFDFELVQDEAIVPVRVSTSCEPLSAFEGLEGIFASLEVQGDPQLVVRKLRTMDNRDVLSVEHAALRADMPEGQVLTTSFDGTPANGVWIFASPLRAAESCAPTDASRVRPPSGLSAELTVSCGGG
jgi:hypothetical protein